MPTTKLRSSVWVCLAKPSLHSKADVRYVCVCVLFALFFLAFSSAARLLLCICMHASLHRPMHGIAPQAKRRVSFALVSTLAKFHSDAFTIQNAWRNAMSRRGCGHR